MDAKLHVMFKTFVFLFNVSIGIDTRLVHQTHSTISIRPYWRQASWLPKIKDTTAIIHAFKRAPSTSMSVKVFAWTSKMSVNLDTFEMDLLKVFFFFPKEMHRLAQVRLKSINFLEFWIQNNQTQRFTINHTKNKIANLWMWVNSLKLFH